jgi:hypothetical protein
MMDLSVAALMHISHAALPHYCAPQIPASDVSPIS